MPFRPTLSLLRNSRFPKVLGICADDVSEVAFEANEVQERLIMDPLAPEEGWWGGWVNTVFNVQVSNRIAYIVTAHDIARVIVMDICQRPRFIRNGFYEYLQFGNGKMPRSCSVQSTVQQAFERDNVPLQADFPSSGPQIIRIYVTNAGDLGKRIIVQGPDQNGKTVFGTDSETGEAVTGERIYFQSPFVDAANRFQNITGLMKDPTLGEVQVFAVDPTTQAQTLLATLEPNQTTASYRRYLVNNLPPNCCNTVTGSVQIQAACKLDFVPVQSDTDYLIIQSIPAMIEEGQAVKYSRMDTEAAAKLEVKHHVKALSLLNGQLDHYLGKTNTAISVPIFGSAKLRPQPI